MKIRNYIYPSVFALAAVLFTSCSPDESGNGNGIVNTQTLDASFTITPVPGSSNRFIVSGSTSGLTHSWNGLRGTDSKELFFPLAGTYNVSHTICGIGGEDCVTATQPITVASDDPIAFNRIDGGEFETAEDIAQWTLFPASVSGASWTFANGTATTTGTQSWAHQNIYQTFEVEAGHDYMFDLHVSGAGGVNNFYFEVYAGFNPPVAGSDYNEGGKILALSTWNSANCGLNPFNGMLSDIGCEGSKIKRFDRSGTVYLVMRTGSEFTPFSVTIDNVSVRAIN